MPTSPSGVFSRIWKFVDQFVSDDRITRSDLDTACDDLATGINDVRTLAEGEGVFKPYSQAASMYAGSHEGAVDRYMLGSVDSYAFFGNPNSYKDYPKWMGVSEAQNALELERYFNAVSGFMSEDIGDRVPQAVVAGVRLIRDDSGGTIIQDNGDKWSMRGPALFENRAQFVAFDTAIKAANSSTFADGDFAGWGNLIVEFDSSDTSMSDASGWKPFGQVNIEHFADNTTPGTTDMTDAIKAALSFLVTNPTFADGNWSNGSPRVIDFNSKIVAISEPIIAGVLDVDLDANIGEEIGVNGSGFLHGIVFENGRVRALPSFDTTPLATYNPGAGVETTVPASMFVIGHYRSSSISTQYSVIDLTFQNFHMDADGVDGLGWVYTENTNNLKFWGCSFSQLGKNATGFKTSTGNSGINIRGVQTKNGMLRGDILSFEPWSNSSPDALPSGDDDGVFLDQTLGGAGNFTLNGGDTAAGTWTSPDGNPWYIEFEGTAGSDLSGVNFTITGEADGASVSETIAGPRSTSKQRWAYSTKAYDTITQISADAAVGANVKCGRSMNNLAMDIATADAQFDKVIVATGAATGLRFRDTYNIQIDQFHPWCREVIIDPEAVGLMGGNWYMDTTDLVIKLGATKYINLMGVSFQGGDPSLVLVATQANETGSGLQIVGLGARGSTTLEHITEGSGTWVSEINRDYNIGPCFTTGSGTFPRLHLGEGVIFKADGMFLHTHQRVFGHSQVIQFDGITDATQQHGNTADGASLSVFGWGVTGRIRVGSGRSSTIGTGSATQTGDEIGSIDFIGQYGATTDDTGADIVAIASDNWSGATRGARITFRQILNGTTAKVEVGDFDNTGYLRIFEATGVKVDGTQVLGTQGAAIADLAVTASTGTLPTANGTVTIADAAAPTNAELLEYCRELEAKLEALLAAQRTHGLIAT